MPERIEKIQVAWSTKEAAIRSLERDGFVDPVDLIEAAKSPEHPCHGDFTWDIEKAAQERWRDQARYLIRKCTFEIKVEEVTERVVRYVQSPDNQPVFKSLPRVRSTTQVSDVMATEIKRLHGNAARVYGIALSKSAIVGTDTVLALERIRDAVADVAVDYE